jgi:hypothetical protein
MTKESVEEEITARIKVQENFTNQRMSHSRNGKFLRREKYAYHQITYLYSGPLKIKTKNITFGSYQKSEKPLN